MCICVHVHNSLRVFNPLGITIREKQLMGLGLALSLLLAHFSVEGRRCMMGNGANDPGIVGTISPHS